MKTRHPLAHHLMKVSKHPHISLSAPSASLVTPYRSKSKGPSLAISQRLCAIVYGACYAMNSRPLLRWVAPAIIIIPLIRKFAALDYSIHNMPVYRKIL